MKSKVSLARAVERYKEATQAIKKEVAELKKEKTVSGERVPDTVNGEGNAT